MLLTIRRDFSGSRILECWLTLLSIGFLSLMFNSNFNVFLHLTLFQRVELYCKVAFHMDGLTTSYAYLYPGKNKPGEGLF